MPGPIGRRGLAVLAVAPGLACVATPALAAGPAPPAAGAPGWRTAATVSRAGFDVGLFSVAAASAKLAWAVGIATSRRTTTGQPEVESWDGSSWSAVRLAAKVSAGLGLELPALVTAAASARAGLWAFTLTGHWLHGDGGGWTAGKLPGGRFVQASLIAGRDTVWAFGATGWGLPGARPFAAFRTAGGIWRRTPIPGRQAGGGGTGSRCPPRGLPTA